MSWKERVIKNVFSNWIGYAVNTIVAFFIAPFVVHTLGNTGYGIWVLVGSLTGYLGILDFGLRPAIVKFVSRYKELNDDQKVNEVINTTLVVFTVIGIVVALASVVLAWFAHRIFVIPPEYHDELRIIIVLVGLNIALSFPFGVFNAMINALQRFDVTNGIQVSVFLARSAFIVVFLKLGGGLVALGIIVLAAGLMEFLLKAWWCYRIFPALKIRPALANRETLRMITGFSVYTFIIGIAMRISFQTDAVVIGAFLSAGAITFYAIGGTLVTHLTALISNITVTITPVASAFDARQDYAKLRNLLVVGTKYCLLIIMPIGLAFLVLGEAFINLWMGPEYGPQSARVLTILMLSYFGYLSQFVAGSVFYGLGKVRLLSMITMGGALVNIALSLILVGPYGIYGVALGTAIPLTIYGTIIQPIYICHLVKLRLLDYLTRSYLPPLLASIPFLAVVWAAERLLIIDSFVEFGVIVALASGMYGMAGFMIGLEPEHRTTILAKARSILA